MSCSTDHNKTQNLLTLLDPTSTNLIIPNISEDDWTYENAKKALSKEFGSPTKMATRKTKFLGIKFQKDETRFTFADSFYLEAQVLTDAGALTLYDAKFALMAATCPYRDLIHILMPAF